MTIGARIWNLGRLLNLREGLRRADDRLPERILSVPHPDGVAAGKALGAGGLPRRRWTSTTGCAGGTPRASPRRDTLSQLSLAELSLEGAVTRSCRPSGTNGRGAGHAF